MEYGIEKNAIRTVAEMAALAARTAPKGHGHDHLIIGLCEKDEIKAIGQRMIAIGEEKAAALLEKGQQFANKAEGIRKDWHSDGVCVAEADEVLLVGLKGRDLTPKNCGMCGHATCAEMLKAERPEGTMWHGPFCAMVMVDLGIAISSAASVAGRNHVDNRIFFKIGNAVNDLGLMPESECVIALAMSSSSKNSFFDRFEKLEGAELQRK
ncbi:MAG: hypothetical protein KBS83_07050 [Lachnospiraceae bacterium]|nr:hypothetical protein [Candidatus Equihabitans merdae]